MNPVAIFIGGIFAGGVAAALWPKESTQVVRALEQSRIDQIVFGGAASAIPPGAPKALRQSFERLRGENTG